jgi:hypothetical protein
MKRIVVLAVLFLFAIAGVAHAQDFRVPTKASAPAAAKPMSMFSKASIEKAVTSVAKSAPAPRMTSRQFWRSPWPYIIAAGIVAVLILAVGGSPLAPGIY